MLPMIASEFGVVKEPEIMFGSEGKAWAKVRCVAKDRTRDAMGKWTDGDPLFIDVIVNVGAEHLVESVTVGDSIIAIGKLSQREYDKDGVKHSIMQFRAESVGVSVKFGPAKTKRMLESSNTTAAIASLQTTEMPF
jgi:single-strand DNA-binding protein